MKISEFIDLVQFDSRKRTGVLLVDNQFKPVVSDFRASNALVIDCTNLYQHELLLTDDQLIYKLRSAIGEQPVLVLNLELFIAPRLSDGFLDQFIRKMAAEEPRQALILLFYSKLIYSKFEQFYQRNPSTHQHTLDLSDGGFFNP